jgi:REP element-mobilizing transposase RayT
MPESLARVYLHIVFSTKNREPCIDVRLRPTLHAYLGGVHRELGCMLLRAGGVEDHMHMLSSVSRVATVANLVEEVKKRSSKWMKRQGVRDFWWQRGYAAFSVGHSQVADTVRYIDRQAEHHRGRTFQEELRHFLRRNEVQYDERYIWD